MSLNALNRVRSCRRSVLLVVLGILFSLVPVTGAVAEAAAPELGAASRPEISHADGHVLVKVAPAADSNEVLAQGAKRVFDRWHTFPVPAGRSAIDTVNALLARPGVEAAELDYRVQLDPAPEKAPISADTTSVNDPYYSYQWHLPAIQTAEAWSTATGKNVVVAVVDTGISQGGQDLDCHTFVAPYNAITDTAGASAASDDNGHGTHVAGTIAQCTDNGVGVAGVAFNAALMPVKALGADGSGSFSWIARGIDWAKDNGADVINMSLGCAAPCSSSIVNDAIESAHAAGVVIVASSGNNNATTVSYPASHPDVIAVGATDYNNKRAPYSDRGTALDLVAPGGDVYQDANGDGYGDGVLQETLGWDGWGYYFYNGTSMASPHVAGVAALLLSEAGCLGADGVQQILQDTALDLGSSGFDSSYGHGLIQVGDALAAVVDTTSPTWSSSIELTASEATATSVKLSWGQASDDTCVSMYHVYEGDTLVKKVAAPGTATTISDLKADTDYTFSVRAIDAAGNVSKPLSVELTALDGAAPNWGSESEVSVLAYGETSLQIGWDAASDNIGVIAYQVQLDGETLATITDRQHEVSGLSPGTEYSFDIQARDAAGNWSEPLQANLGTAYSFGDTAGHTFYGDILWMSGSGVTKGCNPPANDLFCPDDSVTRGQMAAFLVRALELTANTHPGFDDVPSEHTFAADIGKLANAGITLGCNPPTNDLFCPDDLVTRAQMGAFLVRALELDANTHSGFDDVPGDSTFAADIGRLATAGITLGCNPPTNDLFCPEDPLTRGQFGAFLRRALG